MKKRLLSLILAITVIASLLPAMALSASAEDAGYTLTYDFAPDGEAADGKFINTTYDKYASTSGMWYFVGNSGFTSIKSDYYSDPAYAARISDSFVFATGAPEAFFAVKIYVPVTGEYDIAYDYTGRNTNGNPAQGSIYMLSGDTDFSSLTYASLIAQTGACLASEISYGGGNYTPRTNNLATDKNVEKGEYLLVFTADKAIGNSTTVACVFPMALTLTSGDGSLAAPMYGAVASIDKENITVGGAGANITFSGPMSDGSDITAATLTYAVTGDDCVTVTNGTVTGTAVGTANITTSVNGVALNTVTVNVAEAAPDYADYTFTYDFAGTPGDNNTVITSPVSYTDTQGMWAMHKNSRESLQILKVGEGLRIRISSEYWAAFKINVPVGGKYKAVLNHKQYPVKTSTKAGYGNIYLLNGDTEDIAEALETATPLNGDTRVSYVSADIETSRNWKTVLDNDCEIESGEYILVFKGAGQYEGCASETGAYPNSFVLEGDEVGTAYAGVVTLGKNELKKNDTTGATVNVWNTADGKPVSADAIFASDNAAVSVNGSTLTAEALGKAKISATVADSNPISIVPAEVTVVDSTDDSVTFGVYSNIGKGIDFTVDGTLKRGNTVTLTAEDVQGYKFVGWKRGNSLTGKFITDAPQENFEYTVYSNAFITAIYEEENPTDETKVVELWNMNGELWADYTAAEFGALEELPEPEMIGYSFNGWKTADGETFTANSALSDGVIRAVADYTALDVAGPFEAVDLQNTINGASMKYNSPIMVKATNSTFSCWIRNSMIVSYNPDYTYYVWGAATIENGKIAVLADKKPIVILEESFGAYMIEYDAADYEIVEAGIVASNSGTPTVGSCGEKHIAQNTGDHGQFAVKLNGEYSKVRGYVIYQDGEDYKIVYAE